MKETQLIVLIVGLVIALLQWLLKEKIKSYEEKINALIIRCNQYDLTLLKFNDKYAIIQEKVKNLDQTTKSDQENIVKLFNLRFDQILKEYAEIKQDLKEIKQDLKNK